MRLSLILILCLTSGAERANAQSTDKLRAIDGDTFALTIRLENVDTPELGGARCPAERRLAEQARDFTAQWLRRHGRNMTIRISKIDRYGRPVARVSAGGQDLGEALIESKLATPWGTGRTDWCKRLHR